MKNGGQNYKSFAFYSKLSYHLMNMDFPPQGRRKSSDFRIQQRRVYKRKWKKAGRWHQDTGSPTHRMFFRIPITHPPLKRKLVKIRTRYNTLEVFSLLFIVHDIYIDLYSVSKRWTTIMLSKFFHVCFAHYLNRLREIWFEHAGSVFLYTCCKIKTYGMTILMYTSNGIL